MFCLIPKILNVINVVLTVCKFLGMVDAVMGKTAHVQLVVTAQAVGVNDAARFYLLTNNRQQGGCLRIGYGNGINLTVESLNTPTFPAEP